MPRFGALEFSVVVLDAEMAYGTEKESKVGANRADACLHMRLNVS